MTLGQFAVIVGASPRWVQNARAVLALGGRYTEEGARRLGLAREIRAATSMPLRRAWRLAQEALAAWPSRHEWVHEVPESSVRLVVDLERYLSTYAVRLSLSRTRYAERQRGRAPRRPRDPVAAARAYGVDTSLLEDNVKRSPEERLRRLDEAYEFFRAARPVT
jgi:hypothetical protein